MVLYRGGGRWNDGELRLDPCCQWSCSKVPNGILQKIADYEIAQATGRIEELAWLACNTGACGWPQGWKPEAGALA